VHVSEAHITATNRIQVVLFGIQNRALAPYLTAIPRILIPLMSCLVHALRFLPCRKSTLLCIVAGLFLEPAPDEAGPSRGRGVKRRLSVCLTCRPPLRGAAATAPGLRVVAHLQRRPGRRAAAPRRGGRGRHPAIAGRAGRSAGRRRRPCRGAQPGVPRAVTLPGHRGVPRVGLHAGACPWSRRQTELHPGVPRAVALPGQRGVPRVGLHALILKTDRSALRHAPGPEDRQTCTWLSRPPRPGGAVPLVSQVRCPF
jgi:hypothetical protein